MKYFSMNLSVTLMAMIPLSTYAGDPQLPDGWTSNTQEYMKIAAADDRQDRHQERGRSDERQDKRDCRQDEGRVGKDKRDCKQEEVRDGVRGHQGGANGVILSQGGRFGGWSFYLKDGKPVYTYNYLGLERFTVTSTSTVPAGDATILLDFVYDGGGLGKGGLATGEPKRYVS